MAGDKRQNPSGNVAACCWIKWRQLVWGEVSHPITERVWKSPNENKISDGGGWRGPCMADGKAAAEARAVTAGAVRCSAWLGVSGC